MPTEEVTAATYSPAVLAAIADPDGARQFLRDYGELTGWPAGGLKPIPCGSGELAWINAILKFPPVWLGQAIEQIEKSERKAVKYQRPSAKAQAIEERTPDVIIQPSAAGSFIEPGMYRATITDISETTSTYNGKETAQFQFQFVVLDNDGEKTSAEIRGWASQTWHEKSKLFEWSRAILGRKCPAVTEAFDTDKLLNKKCDLDVVTYRKQDGSEGTKIGKVYPYQSMTKEADDSED